MTLYNKLLTPIYWLSIFTGILFPCSFSIAQTAISGQINNYTPVTSFSGECRNVVTIGNPTGFSAGTHALIIQMQGATINESNDISYGEIIEYNGAGLYEKAIIQVVDGSEITFAADLVNTYDVSGKVQLITVPQYTDIIVNGPLTALPWNGTTGGVLAFEASGTVTLNANISVDGKGFKGGGITINNQTLCGTFPFPNSTSYYYTSSSWQSAFKGEGIAEIIPGRELGRGSQATGGGGGNDHNTGGGGGGNYGDGGGGGENRSPIFPCNGPNPGLGGRSATLANRAFLGGGGGGGHSNNNAGTQGGNGGGIIYMKAGILNANGNIISANGDSAEDGAGDGGGGGGAGGTILLNLTPSITNLTVQAQGGNGATIGNLGQNRCFGPGGGGGGLVASTVDLSDIVSGITDVALAGGNPGRTINSSASCNNSTNGATAGGTGIVHNSLFMPMGNTISGDQCNFIPTPVEFIQFTAKLENNQVKLEWITASETNNDYFAVERSDDNQIFTQITRVIGNGDSYDIKKYQTVDWNPLHGTSYYRIRQVDYDGKFSYSKVVAIENNQNHFSFTVFPNPVQIDESFNLKIYMPEEETVQIQLVDLIGRVIFSIDKHLYKGQNAIELDAATITSGVYFIYVKTSKGYKVQKVKAVK